MTKKLIKKSLVYIFSAILLLFVFLGGFSFMTTSAEVSTNVVNVTVLSRNNQELPSPTSTEFNGGKAFTYLWEEAQNITLAFTPIHTTSIPDPYTVASGSEIGTSEDVGKDYYNIKVKVEYLQGYLSAGSFDVEQRIEIENVFEQNYISNTNIGYNNFSYTYNIDNGITYNSTNTGETFSFRGWGIYRFSLTINNQTYTGDFINIQPNNASVIPTFEYVTQGSKTSMHNEFVCKVTNVDAFRFADTTLITWFVKGKTLDGTLYALTKADLQTMEDCTEYLYESIDRNGLEFTFNDKNYTGEWQIWCTFSPDNSTPLSSEPITVTTGFHVSVTLIVSIIVSIMLVSVAVVCLIQYVKVKKEKVW